MSEPTATELESQERMSTAEVDEYADPNLTPMARNLRIFLQDLGRYLGGVAMELEKEHKDSEASTVKRYADAVDRWLLVPYADFVPQETKFAESVREAQPDARRGSDYRPDCKACRELLAHTKHTLDGDNIREGQAEANPQPDLRTLEGALAFIDYHSPDDKARTAHEIVNKNFQTLVTNVWQNVPAGPGKTVWLRKMNEARMAANAAIATHGA